MESNFFNNLFPIYTYIYIISKRWNIIFIIASLLLSHQFTLVDSVHFSLFGPLQSILSNLVYSVDFSLILHIQSTSVHFSLFGQPQSISVYFSPSQSILVYSVHFSPLLYIGSSSVHFSSFRSFRSTSVYFGPLQSFLFHSVQFSLPQSI